MLRFIVQRLGQTVIVLFVVSLIVFSLVHLTPGDPVDAVFSGQNVTAQQKDEYRHQLGLDRSLPQQYLAFAGGAVRGDLGTSLRSGRPVWSMIATTLPATLELVLAALVIAIVIAVPVAIVSALRQGSVWDRTGSFAALFGISMPSFWLGMMLILVFSVSLHLFPASGRLSIDTGLSQLSGLLLLDSALQGNWQAFVSGLQHLALPALTLGAAIAATLTRILRSGLLEVKDQDYVEALWARGLSFWQVLRHMMPTPCRRPSSSWVCASGGAAGWRHRRGDGVLLAGYGALDRRLDSQPRLSRGAGCGARHGGVFVLFNLATDLLHGWLDPRVKHTKVSA